LWILSRLLKAKAPFILPVALAFFIYQLILLINSFPADYRIAVRDLGQFYSSGSIWSLFHLGSELTGEVGVILRFAGACFFLDFSIALLLKKTVSWPLIRKAVLLEGIYYLFNIPFIIYLFARPNPSIATYGAAISYTAQLLLVTPVFLWLYLKIKNERSEGLEKAKWAALAVTGFVFALWVKHFLMAIYALPTDFSDTLYLAGFLNSALTIAVGGILLIFAFMPLYRKRSTNFSHKMAGAGLIVVSLYGIIFVILSLISTKYMGWINLIDWWIIVFAVLGFSLAVKARTKRF